MVSVVLWRFKKAWAAIGMVSARLADMPGTERRRARQAKVDAESRSGTTNDDAREIEALLQEAAHLGQDNEMPPPDASTQIAAAEAGLVGQRSVRAGQGAEDSDASSATSASAGPPASIEENASNPYVALEPLSKYRLKKRMSELFPTGYLTLMAIVQGVALVELLDGVKHEVFSSLPYLHRLTAAVQALAVLAAIVIITHRYFLLTVLARWRPTVIDTLLPYLLGTSEAAAALLIGHNVGWWIALSVLFLAATTSFVHTLMRGNEATYGKLEKLYTSSRSAVKKQLITCAALMLFSVSIALITIYSGALPAQAYIVFICATIVAFTIVAIIGERDRNRAFSFYGIPDRRGRISDQGQQGTEGTGRS